MKKYNTKVIGLLLIGSFVLNALFALLIGRNLLQKYYRVFTLEGEVSTSKSNLQSDSISYFLGRNDVFLHLPNDSTEIVMLGNSLTQSFEWHEAFRDLNIKNRGINSDITKGVLLRLEEVLESKPRKIFIEIGINDLMQGVAVDTVYEYYTRIIEQIKEQSPRTKIYVQSLLPTTFMIYGTQLPVSDRVLVLNRKLQDYCRFNKLTYIELYSKFLLDGKLNPSYYWSDALHLSGRGYQEWCNLIRDYVYE